MRETPAGEDLATVARVGTPAQAIKFGSGMKEIHA